MNEYFVSMSPAQSFVDLVLCGYLHFMGLTCSELNFSEKLTSATSGSLFKVLYFSLI